jgi:hypothetical protein
MSTTAIIRAKPLLTTWMVMVHLPHVAPASAGRIFNKANEADIGRQSAAPGGRGERQPI